MTFHGNFLGGFVHVQNLFCVGHLRQPQLFGNLRAYLGGIAVDGLASADDDVIVAYLLDGCGKGIRSGKRIGTCKGAVGQQIAVVGTTVKSFTNNFGCTSRSHGQDGNGGARMFIFQSESLLKSVQVFGVEDGRECRAVDGSVGFHGIFPNIACVGNLFCQYNNFQTHAINY